LGKSQLVPAPHENEAMLIPPFEIVGPRYVASWLDIVSCHGEDDEIALEFSGYLQGGAPQ